MIDFYLKNNITNILTESDKKTRDTKEKNVRNMYHSGPSSSIGTTLYRYRPKIREGARYKQTL